jgi:hypothetical protein
MTKAQEYIVTELERRMVLVEDPKFIELAINYSKKLGVTAKDWNENKAGILMLLANKACGIENELNN